MTYPTPGPGTIAIPLADEVPRATAAAIKGATGVDIHRGDPDQTTALALAWWYARVLPWYDGLPYTHVRDHWDATMTHTVARRGPRPWTRWSRRRRS